MFSRCLLTKNISIFLICLLQKCIYYVNLKPGFMACFKNIGFGVCFKNMCCGYSLDWLPSNEYLNKHKIIYILQISYLWNFCLSDFAVQFLSWEMIYSRLSLSRSQRVSLKPFEISLPRHIRFAELRKTINRTTALTEWICNLTPKLEIRENIVEKRRNCS